MATEAGSTTKPPAAQTPLSAAPRRSCRARRVNSRFDNDEVDESFRQLVARIAAPDSHSILQSPQLAFHCPNPTPPPPPQPPAPPVPSPVQQRADLTAPSSNISKKGVNQSTTGSSGNKKKGTIVLKKSVSKKSCKDSESANKDKKKKTSQVQGKSVKKSKSTLLQSKKSLAFDSSSEDEVPLAKFASRSVTSSGLASDDDLPLAELVPKKDTSDSYSCGLPGNYSIKTIHNPDLSNTPISIVCIEDPDETRPIQVKKVKRKSFSKMFNLSKKSKLALPHGHKKDNDSLSESSESKTVHKNSLDHKKSKHKMSMQPTQGKLLKIVNLKVVPNSLCDFSNNNPLRKFIENKTSSPTFSEKSEEDGLTLATLSDQSERIVSPSSMCLQSENITEKSSQNDIYGKYGAGKSSQFDSETELCQVQNKCSDDVKCDTTLAVSDCSDSSRKAAERVAQVLSGSGSLPKLSASNKQEESILNLTFNETKEGFSNSESNDCISVSKGKRKLEDLGKDNYSLKSNTRLGSNTPAKLNKDKLKSNGAEYVKSLSTDEKDPHTKINLSAVNNFLPSNGSSPFVPLIQDVTASHASKTLDKSSLSNSSSYSFENSSSFGTPVVSTPKIKLNVSSSEKSSILFPLESASKLTTTSSEDWSTTHSKTSSEKSSPESKFCSDQHHKFSSSSKNHLKSSRPSLSKSSVAKVELRDSIAEKDVCLTGHNLKESRKSQDMDNQFHLHSNENMSNIKDTKIFNKESNKHYKRRTDDPTTSGNKKVKHENEDSCSKTKSTSVKYTLGNVLLYSQSNHVTTNATIKSERDKSDNKISKTNKADVSRLPEGDSVGLSSVKHLKCEPYEEKPDIAMIRDTNEQLEVEVKNKGFLHVEKRLDDKYLSLVKSEITHKEKSIEQHGDGQLSHERAKVKSVASSPSAKKLPEVSNASTNLCENKSDHCKAKQNHSLSSHSLSNLPEVKTDYEKIKEKVVSSPENIKNSHGDKTAHDKKDKALLSLNNTRNLAENKTDRNLDKNSDLSKAIPTSETVDSKADIKPSLLITKIIEGTGDDKQYSLKSGDCLTLAKETNTSSVNNENISTYNDTLSSHKTVSQGGAHFHTSMKKEPEDVYENCRVSPTSDVKAVFCSTSACDEGELVSGDPSRSREKGSSSNRHKEASHHKSSGKHKHSSKERHRRFDSSSKSSTSSSYKSSSQKKSDSHSDCDKHEKVHSDEKHRRRDSSKSSHKDRDKNERDKVSKSTVIKSDEKVSNKAVLTSAKLEEPTRSSVVNVYEPPAKEASITSVKEDLLTTFVNTSESSASPTLSTILDENGKCVSPVIELLNMCRANIPKNDPEVDKNVVENSLSISFPAAVFVPPHQNKKVALDSVEYKCLVTENKTQVSDHSLSLEEATSTSLCLPSNKSSSVKCENDTDSQPNLESPRIISVNNREKSVKRSRETDSSDSDVSNESDYGNSKVSSKSRKQKSTSSPEFSLKSTKSKPIKRDIISDLPAEVNDDKADSEKLFGEFSLNDKPVTKVGNSINVPLVPAPIDNLPESCPALPADIKPPPLGTPESVSPAPVIETPEERMLREVAEAESAAERERRNETIVEQRMKAFEHLTENFYLIERKKSKQSKEVRRMVCDCTLTKEELLRGEKGCGDDCLNRLLMIECGWRCPLGTSCINRNFQSGLCAPVKVFNAEQKGCGVVATEEIPPGTFIMEYVGEVFDQREFRRRRKEYGRDGTAHFYFMALKADQFIDATRKGNISRFVNHSCDPNAETQKWTVNGELRVGFFSTKTIKPGEEINFDYRMERYGREPQKCYCGTAVCRGWLGEPPDEKTKEEKEEERRRASSTAPDRRKKEDKKQYDDELQDDLCELQRAGLRNRQDTLLLSRVMVRAESEHTRTQLLLLLRAAHTNTPCLRLFLDYHGLSLLWSWMADLDSAMLHAPLKLQILKTLDILPITNRTQVTDSRVLEVVEKWSKQTPEPASAVTTVTPPTGTPASVESSLEDSTKKTSDTSEDSDDVVTDECSLDSMDAKGVSSKAQQQQSPDDNSSSSDSMSGAKTSSKESLVSGVLQQPSRETTPEQHPAALSSQEEFRNVQLEVVSLAGELLARWQVLKEEFRIPKKQRVQLMREHERQVDADYRRYLDTERGRREMMERSYSGTRRDSYQDRYRSRMPVLDKDGRRCWQVPQLCDDAMLMNGDEFAGLSKEERREKFAQKVAIQDEQRRVQESMWSVHVERCVRSGLDPYLAPIVDPSGNYYWDAGNSAWVPLTPQTAFAASVLNPALAQEQQAARLGYNSVAEMEAAYANPHAIPIANGEVIPPVVVTISLPPHWHIARDQHNRLYFYHSRSRQTQWDIPTLETKTTLQYEMDSESDSESSSSSDSEEFSSDEGNGNEDEAASSAAGETADDEPETVEGKIIRRQRGKKKHSEALVQQRVISPIREMDRELARKERREAKERARHEARKERLLLQNSSADAKEDDGDDEEKTDDIIVKMPHKPREKLKVKSKERAATAIADTSEKARKLKDLFRSRMATFIVSVLNPYRRADCRQGRINTTEDFKYLARKLTHFVMVKELKQLPSIESLDCNDSVKHKTKDFVRKYMAKYGSSFKRDPLDTKEY